MKRAPVRLKKAEIKYIKSLPPKRTFDPFVINSIQTTLRIRRVNRTISMRKIT